MSIGIPQQVIQTNSREMQTRNPPLASGGISEEEKQRQANKTAMQKKYRNMSLIMVFVIVVAAILLYTQINSVQPEPIVVTVDNWSNYFVISKEIIDTSLILDDVALYSMETNYTIRLKDVYAERLDNNQVSKVMFSLTYQECMGLFDMDYKDLKYTEPDSFNAVKDCTASVVLEYPYSADSQSNIIYSVRILGGGEPDDTSGIGFVGRDFTVTSANGTLYLKERK